MESVRTKREVWDAMPLNAKGRSKTLGVATYFHNTLITLKFLRDAYMVWDRGFGG